MIIDFNNVPQDNEITIEEAQEILKREVGAAGFEFITEYDFKRHNSAVMLSIVALEKMKKTDAPYINDKENFLNYIIENIVNPNDLEKWAEMYRMRNNNETTCGGPTDL